MAAIPALGIASMALTALGTVAAISSSMQQAKASRSAAEYNKQVAENNAKMITDQANYEAGLQRDKARRLMGSQAAAFGKTGADMSGSALDVTTDSIISSEQDTLATLYKGQVARNNAIAGGNLAYSEGMASSSSAMGNALGIGLSGAAKMATTGYDLFNKPKTASLVG